MKKLLGICALAGVFWLSACSTGGVTVCIDANGDMVRAYHADGEVTSFVMTQTEDISDMDEEEIAFFTHMADSMPEAAYSIDDDILTLTITLDADGILASFADSLDLDEFIANAEANGATCE